MAKPDARAPFLELKEVDRETFTRGNARKGCDGPWARYTWSALIYKQDDDALRDGFTADRRKSCSLWINWIAIVWDAG